MGNGLSDQTSILSSLPSFQSFHIVILGLDCAGKTTVLYRLRFNEFVNTVPTKGFNTEKIKVDYIYIYIYIYTHSCIDHIGPTSKGQGTCLVF
uniref:ADP ribosylation factor like GTPase 4A n=1 Tax=Equus asinus asinus TaxID=83772 RepID=A0A8C4MUJ6_EQUAS